jgi:AcrR family transcriptional regulator
VPPPPEPSDEGEAPTRGRPRDPELESRALTAALEVFAEKGWAGLTIDAVASRARVGKSALYLRWADKGELLSAALRNLQDVTQADVAPTAGEAGPGALDQRPGAPGSRVRDYLIGHATRRAELYLTPNGLAMIRLYAEALAHPELLAEVREQALTRYVLDERDQVAAAIGAGELSPDASPMRILDAVEGAVFMHILVTPPQLRDRVRAGIGEYVEKMVDDQLRAAGYTGSVALTPPGS